MRPHPPKITGLTRFLPFVVPLLVSLPGLLQVADPPGRDQGVFATIAWQWLEGAVPYLDAGVEHKGPLVLLAYALPFRLFGPEMWGVRLAGWCALLATALIVVAIARRVPGGSPARAATAGGLYAAITQLSGLSGWWSGAQSETFMEPFLALAVFGVTGPAVKLRHAAAGVALGVALLGKPTALALGAILAVGALPAFGAGALLPPLLAAAWLFLVGALPAAFDQIVVVNFDYGRRGLTGLPERVSLFAATLFRHIPWPWWIPAAAGLSRSGVERRWLLAALVMIVIQGRFFAYHFLPLAAPFALLAAAGAARLHATLPLAARPALYLALVGGLLLLPLSEFGWRLERAAGGMTAREEAALLSPPASGNDVDPAETAEVAAWLAAHTEPGATVLVWGFEPAINALARRRAPTRFLYDYQLTSPDLAPHRQEAAWRQFRADLARRPADWIIVVHNDTNPVERIDSATQLRNEPELRRLLSSDYEEVTRIGDFAIHRRSAAAGATTAPR